MLLKDRFDRLSRILPALYCLLILAPLIFSPPFLRVAGEGIPRPLVFIGDEPHYLVYANSLWRDGDFDLSNNYRAAGIGDGQAGLRFAARPLQHHSVYYVDGEYFLWYEIFTQRLVENHDRGKSKLEIFEQNPRVARAVNGRPEYSLHPPGLPMLLAALFRPLGRLEWLESGALLLSGVMVLTAMLLFRSLLAVFGILGLRREVITGLVFLATPIWHYGRVLYTESFTLCLLLAAFILFLREEKGLFPLHRLFSGSALGLAILIKPASLLFCLPLGADLLLRRRFREFAALAIAPSLAGLVLLLLNDMMFGSPWLGSQKLRWGDPIEGLPGILFSYRHGLIPHAPILLIALLLWPSFYRSDPRLARLLLGLILPSLLLAACWPWWEGGVVYGPRLIVPLIPLLALSLVELWRGKLLSGRLRRISLFALCVFSLTINALGAFQHARHTMSNPLDTISESFSGWLDESANMPKPRGGIGSGKASPLQ
jgi:hypothetical protein